MRKQADEPIIKEYGGYEIHLAADEDGDIWYALYKGGEFVSQPFYCFEDFSVAEEWAREEIDEMGVKTSSRSKRAMKKHGSGITRIPYRGLEIMIDDDDKGCPPYIVSVIDIRRFLETIYDVPSWEEAEEWGRKVIDEYLASGYVPIDRNEERDMWMLYTSKRAMKKQAFDRDGVLDSLYTIQDTLESVAAGMFSDALVFHAIDESERLIVYFEDWEDWN